MDDLLKQMMDKTTKDNKEASISDKYGLMGPKSSKNNELEQNLEYRKVLKNTFISIKQLIISMIDNS